MKRFQFDNLTTVYHRHLLAVRAAVQARSTPPTLDITLYMTKGAQAGSLLRFKSVRQTNIMGLVGNEEVTVGYQNAEHTDEQGQPQIVGITDMTGRLLEVDTWVCYSRSTAYSHSLEIGRITKLTPSGGLKVTPYVTDGTKLEKSKWSRHERIINNPDRTIKLPVEISTMTMWILKDFDLAQTA